MIIHVFTALLVTADTDYSWIDYIIENWVVITVSVTIFIFLCCCCYCGACCYACYQNDCSCDDPGKFCFDCLICPCVCMIYFSESEEQQELRKTKDLLTAQETAQMLHMYFQQLGMQQEQQQEQQQTPV